MKRFLVLLVFCTTISIAHSQFSAGMHAGASEKNVLIGFHTQYQFGNRFTPGFNMTTHVNNSDAAFFQTRFGFTIGNYRTGLSVLPYAGYSFRIQNIEKNNYGGNLCYGAQLRYQISNIALVYSDFNIPTPKTYLISVGIAGRLPLRYE